MIPPLCDHSNMCSNLVHAVLAAHGGRRVNTLLRRQGPVALHRLYAAMRPDERAALDEQAEMLRAGRVGAVLLGDPDYPAALAASPGAPSTLFHRGPIELLHRPVLVLYGGPDASDGELIAADMAARIAAGAGMTVVSGDPGGVGGAAAVAALRHGGDAGLVLAEALRPGATGTRDAGRLVVVSQFPPGLPWSVDTAMARNATLAGLGTALVAVAAGSTGGTLDAGLRALELGRPVLAVGDTPGSRLLVDHGATPARDRIELAWWLDRLKASRERAVSCA